MAYTNNGTRKRIEIIEVRYPAWQRCGNPECSNGKVGLTSETVGNCVVCHGEGGWWHEKVTVDKDQDIHSLKRSERHGIRSNCFSYFWGVTKSSIIILSGEACMECRDRWRIRAKIYDGKVVHPDCTICHGTGIDPATAEWRVE